MHKFFCMKTMVDATIKTGLILGGLIFLLVLATFASKSDGTVPATARVISSLGPGSLYGLLFLLVLVGLLVTFFIGWRIHKEARETVEASPKLIE